MLALPASSSDDEEPVDHPFHKPVYKLFSRALKAGTPPIQSTACTALCKLMLSSPSITANTGGTSILNNDKLLSLLTIAYFDPETSSNPSLRQTLSYFLPVYCHSRKENMQRMGRIATDILMWFLGVKEELDVEGEDDASGEMVGSSVVVAHLVDWTDSRKLAAAMSGIGAELIEDDGEVHLDWAIELGEKVLGVSSSKSR
jgi:condensin complex subunit 3